MKFVVLIAMIAAGVAGIGCTSVAVSEVESGLFENRTEKIIAAYELLGREPITQEKLKEIGFDLSAPNIERIPGSTAFRRIFGDRVFNHGDGARKLNSAIKEFSNYSGFVIPYRKMITTSDRIYFSEKTVRREGELLKIILLFRDDMLCYHELEYSKVDIYYSRYAFGEAILTIIKSPGSAALDIIATLQEYQQPGLEPFIPIPIP